MAKVGPGDLDDILRDLPLPTSPALLVGPRTLDDAGVWRLDDERALVLTLDFFTPFVEDPKVFGRIAAANALSDVYAMGGRPLAAMNIVCFPAATMDHRLLRLILEGAHEVLVEAGCDMAGGHTVEDPKVKFGLSVTGLVDPRRMWPNAGARAGDALVLTKPLGSGILLTAERAGLAAPEHTAAALAVMGTLNRAAAEVGQRHPVGGATDITGFGLVGHALGMARASSVRIVLRAGALPLLPGVLDYAGSGFVPEGAWRNRVAYAAALTVEGDVDPLLLDVAHDPQTSGGLLLALPAAAADALVADLHGAGVTAAARVGFVEATAEPGLTVRQ